MKVKTAKVMDGPYFFLKIYETAPATIALWFGIIVVLCGVLSGVYMRIRTR